jgi:2-keto-4-pentenoate hydratase/2-oxohepta-3-ene-1,7-dioic acid hydratase in catechol pathway
MATKLVTFADGKGQRAGALLDGGRVLDLGSAVLGPLAGQAGDMLSLIEAGPAALAAVRALAAEPPPAPVLDAGAVRLLAPIPRPRRNVFCVGRNYMDHVAEGDRTRGIEKSELPKYPQFFTKAPECVIGPEEAIPTTPASRNGSTTRWSWPR